MYPVKFDLDQGSDNDITVRETKLGDPAEKPADPTKPNLVSNIGTKRERMALPHGTSVRR